MRGSATLKQEDTLKKKSGLLDFLGEVNDCFKNLLRMMNRPDNCFSMYGIDFLWKMMLVRIEYHLDDEEQRLQKVQRFYEAQLKKEISDALAESSLKEQQLREQIARLERTKESQYHRIEKLMADKGQLIDSLRDKEDELQFLKNPATLAKFGDLSMELDAYIGSMTESGKEQRLALRGMKLFIDTLAGAETLDQQTSPMRHQPSSEESD